MMIDIDRLTSALIRHEGKVFSGNRHRMYTDSVGKITIGFGRNLSDRGLSETEAQFLLLNDIQEVIDQLRHDYQWFDELNDVRQEVIINMAFNMGISGFGKFKKTIRLIDLGTFDAAAREMLASKWARQVGSRADELSGQMATGMVEA
jgi:lysozyme